MTDNQTNKALLSEGMCVFCDKIRNNDFEKMYGYYTDNPIVRFIPLNPVVIGHKLFISSHHTADAAENPTIAGMVFRVASQHAQQMCVPYNLITSGGTAATQSIFIYMFTMYPVDMETELCYHGQIKRSH